MIGDMHQTNETHDPSMKSWVEAANDPATDFPIQNLPLGVYLAEHDGHAHPHLAMAIGDQLVDITTLAESGVLGLAKDAVDRLHVPNWAFAAVTPGLIPAVRRGVQAFLRADAPGGQQARRLRQKCVRPIAQSRLLSPVRIGNYTDFYASIHHATNVGSMFRPDQPLLPNYKHVPIGYHGRASSLILSGGEVRRPLGQQSPPEGQAAPAFGPTAMLDYELEVGCIIGAGNPMGDSIPLSRAEQAILGLCLVNDWSARDVQKWEYQPLGPFLAKNFATSVSPFIVTMEALAPFRTPGAPRGAGDPQPLPYLTDENDRLHGGFDITLEAAIQTEKMRAADELHATISRGSFKDMYWTFGQMLAHHTVNGCNMQTGDLIASGTVSGPGEGSRGCLLELTWAGIDPATGKPRPRKPVTLPNGETRTFLQDGDSVLIRGFCEREGFRRIGMGICRGVIVPAKV